MSMVYTARFGHNRIQSVKEHLDGVTNLCEIFCAENALKNTAKLCGKLHDMGKYSHHFQTYIADAQSHQKDKTYAIWIKTVKKFDHGVFGAKYIHSKSTQKDSYEKLTCNIIAEVICYHHGGLPDNLNANNEPTLTVRIGTVTQEDFEVVSERYFSENSRSDIENLFAQAVCEITQIYGKIKGKTNFWLGLLIKQLYSILVDADRLDSYLFESEKTYDNTCDTNSLWHEYALKLEDKLQHFKEASCTSPLEKTVKETREKISQNCFDFAYKPTGIYTLTVPTGGGKTLASFLFALNHAIHHKKKRIFYIIPYTSIIEQNAEELRKILSPGDNLLEYHSNVLDCNKGEDYDLLCDRFTSPIIFTTMVQFLNAIYATGNQNIRRMHNLENSIIIFDEVQSVPIKCIKLFYESVNYLNKIANSTIILCTATQPKLGSITDKLKLKIDDEIIPNVLEPFQKLKRMEVIDKTDKVLNLQETADFILQIKASSNSILTVMNTVSSAENLFDALKVKLSSSVKLYLLTTRLCPAHRQSLIRELKSSLSAGDSIICVSTQLIEAGVDISFSTTIRSLTGLDSIAQSSGRGNRHGESAIGSSYIIKTSFEKISRLPEIKYGQIHASEVLHLYRKHPEDFESSLLSPKSISAYYLKFYGDDEINGEMEYSIPDSESLYSLLTNKKSRRPEQFYPLMYTYQFETARKNFEVIDSQTQSVLVPYNDSAKDIISTILCDNSLDNKLTALKQSQKYSVNIYSNIYSDLSKKSAFIPCQFDAITILSETFYSAEKGLTLDNNLPVYDF